MSLGTNTITITIDETPKVLVRINQDKYTSEYYLHETDQEFTVNVRHSQEGFLADGSRYDRHNVEIIHTVFGTVDSPSITRTAYAVFRNKRSDDYDAVADLNNGLVAFLDATTITDLLSWKS